MVFFFQINTIVWILFCLALLAITTNSWVMRDADTKIYKMAVPSGAFPPLRRSNLKTLQV